MNDSIGKVNGALYVRNKDGTYTAILMNAVPDITEQINAVEKIHNIIRPMFGWNDTFTATLSCPEADLFRLRAMFLGITPEKRRVLARKHNGARCVASHRIGGKHGRLNQ